MVSSVSSGSLSDKDISGFDSNVLNGTSGSLYINGNSLVGIYVVDATGAHTTHVLTAQISTDDANWFTTSNTVTGEGYVEFTTASQYVRVKLTTAEGGTSTCDISITSK